ncbi:hypothetical protein ACFX14_035266 [Malus domestica]
MHNELLLVSCTDKCPLEPPATILRTSEGIKVLAIRSRFPLPILPSIPLLRNLQTLRLENCNLSVEARSVIGELRTLMVLSFCGSNFDQFPDEIKNLSNLRLLDLTGCRVMKIPMGVISSLAHLEELYLWNSFQQWEVEEQTQAQLDEGNRHKDRNQGSKIRGITCHFAPELSSLSQLTTLEIALNPLVKSTGVQFDQLERFKISIGWWNNSCWDVNPCENYLRLSYAAESPAESRITILLEKTNVLELDMKYMSRTLNDLRRSCCLNLKSLKLCQSEDLQHVFDIGYVSVFPVLHTLKINELKELKAVFHGELPMGSFNGLRELSLSSLPKLTHLWKIPSQFGQCLGNLRCVKVSRCYLLKYLFLLSVDSHLKQLEELDIQNCNYLEEIVALKDQTSKQIVASEGSENEEEVNEINHPNLLRLNLERLPGFVGISKTTCQINFPGLITLKLEYLPKIMSLSPDSLAPESSIAYATKQHLFDTKVSPFWQLRFVTVKECAKLTGIFSFSWVQDLQSLEQLEVRECRSLETVFDFEDLEMKQNPKQFPALFSDLEIMELSKLPLLKYLWNPPQNIMAFQNLRMLQVMQCGNLRYVFPRFVAENLVKLESMYISDCAAMRDILAENERGHGDEEATKIIVFPQVKSLHLDNLPSLRTFCRAPCAIHWPSLTTLVIGCLTMETFVPSSEAMGSIYGVPNHIFNEEVGFPVLETLEIRDMQNIRELWSRELLPYSFNELRDLHVSGCSNLVLLVAVEVQNRLHKLDKLIVKGCNSLEEIFESTGSNANEEPTATLPQSGEISSISQPQMTQIRGSNRIQGFQLTSLHISDCVSLELLLSPSIARGMVKLKGLSIIECKKMEVVVAKPLADEESEDNSLLPQLSYLELRALPNLIIFSQGKCNLDWPSLEELTVEECPRMENLCLGSLSTPREVKLSISGASENLQKELNDSRKET